MKQAVEAKCLAKDVQATEEALKHDDKSLKAKPISTTVFYKGKEMTSHKADHLAAKLAVEQKKDIGKQIVMRCDQDGLNSFLFYTLQVHWCRLPDSFCCCS